MHHVQHLELFVHHAEQHAIISPHALASNGSVGGESPRSTEGGVHRDALVQRGQREQCKRPCEVALDRLDEKRLHFWLAPGELRADGFNRSSRQTHLFRAVDERMARSGFHVALA